MCNTWMKFNIKIFWNHRDVSLFVNKELQIRNTFSFYVSMSTTRHRYYSLQPINPLMPLSLVVTYLWGSFWPVVLILSEQGSGRRLWMFYRVACRSKTVIKCSWESIHKDRFPYYNGSKERALDFTSVVM